jgi:hypothetical protein
VSSEERPPDEVDDHPAVAVHAAIGDYLDEGEIAVAWTLTIDVAGPDGTRYLAHRAGGGMDGTDAPTVWTALGMLRAGLLAAEQQVFDCADEVIEDEDE